MVITIEAISYFLRKILLISFMAFLISTVAYIYSNRFVIEIEKNNLGNLRTELEKKFSLIFKGHIHSDFYLFIKSDLPSESSRPWESEDFANLVKSKSVSYEQEILRSISRTNPFKSRQRKKILSSEISKDNLKTIYDMGIEQAWSKDYSGRGVVVAVVDSGVQINHTDLKSNLDNDLSCDIILQTRDSSPKDWESYPDRFEQFDHGTNCAGLIAAVQNDVCTTGVAPNAKIASLLVIDPLREGILESDSAKAFTHENNKIEIYSNSWGTTDSDCGFLDFSKHTSTAFQRGVKEGRSGKGSLFVFPSGNGQKGDNCNADPYANSIYTLTIGSVDTFGKIPEYAEPCSCVLASTLGSGSRFNSSYLLTTSLGDECTEGFSGTSASAAMASGIIALVLGINPNLTKRDIEHIIVKTSKTETLDPSAGWKINGANVLVSDYFGFGLMDADAMINEAKHWNHVPALSVCSIEAVGNEVLRNTGFVRIMIPTDGCRGTPSEIETLEYVQLQLDFHTLDLDLVIIELSSPMETTSTLLSRRTDKCDPGNRKLRWNFTSSHFWGEDPKGNWTIHMSNIIFPEGLNDLNNKDKTSENNGVRSSLIMYGTSGQSRHIEETIEVKIEETIEVKPETDDEIHMTWIEIAATVANYLGLFVITLFTAVCFRKLFAGRERFNQNGP